MALLSLGAPAPARADASPDLAVRESQTPGVARVLSAIGLAAVAVAAIAAIRVRRPNRAGVRWWRNLLPDQSQATDLRILMSTRLAGRASMHVVRWGARDLLVGCTDGSMAVLAEREVERAMDLQRGDGPRPPEGVHP
jgi:hypothetical protein